jgi:hypothetical protein
MATLMNYHAHETHESIEDGRNTALLRQVAVGELKWGVVVKPTSNENGVTPGHISFGTLDSEVEEVVHGEIYE